MLAMRHPFNSSLTVTMLTIQSPVIKCGAFLSSLLDGPFLNVTTSETKIGFLLIEVFSKLFNTQNYGHQGSILGGFFYFHLSVDIPDKISKILTTEHSSSLLPPKSKTHRTRCHAVTLLDCGAFFVINQDQ